MSITYPAASALADNAGMAEVETAVELFERRSSAGQSTVVVFYRGERSFFCKQWLRRWLAIPAIERRLELAGVVILFVSSQSQGKAYSVAAQIAARRPALDARVYFFGDPEHLLVAHLGESGYAKPIITNPESHRAHGWVFDYGMVQPAVLATASDGSVLYQWVSKPSILNVAGKLDRPDPFDVWDTIERRLDRIRITKARAARTARAAAAVSQSVTTEPSEGPVSEDLAAVKAQPSLHSLGDVHPAPTTRQNAREEKSDSELTTNMSRKTSDRSIIRTKDRQPSATKPIEPRVKVAAADHELPLASGETTPSLRRNGESDNNLAPLSTNIETLTNYALSSEKTLSREEPDVSDGDIASIPVKVLSSNINALASEVLAENTLSLHAPHTEATHSSPGLANRGHVERIISGPLTEDFVDEFEDIGDTKVVSEEEELGDGEFELAVVRSEKDSSDSSSQTATDELEDGSRMNEGTEIQAPPMTKRDYENDIGDDEGDESEQDESFSTDELEVEHAGNEFVGSTKSAHDGRVASLVEPPTKRHTSAVFASKPNSPMKETKSLELHNSPTQGANADQVEAKVPSLGSDQIETSMMTSRFGSMRTEDSAQANTYDETGSSAERLIVEEADDKKTGISDYLRELKGPEKRHYRVRGATASRPTQAKDAASSSKAVVSESDTPAVASQVKCDAMVETAADSQFEKPVSVRDRGATVDLNPVEQSIIPQATSRNEVVEPSTDHVDILSKANQERKMIPETDSPHPELHSGQRSTVDLSPFADADHNFNTPGDQLMKPAPVSLRDEYEAYDEYIVCEFEVEEFVEEYDSDTTSRSRVFVTAVVDEESHATGLTTEGRTVTGELPIIDATRVVPMESEQIPDASGGKSERAHVRIAETAPETIPPVDEERRSPIGVKQTNASGGAIGSVRAVLRRITIPVFSVARLTGSRQQNTEAATVPGEKNSATGGDRGSGDASERDTGKLSRKDTIRSVLRMKPTGVFHRGAEGGDDGIGESDEHMAKLGRKETLKSVLRKIPVPKTRKRQHTVEGVNGSTTRENAGAWREGGDGGRGAVKKGGLQAVLERLPSLSASGSRKPPTVVANMNVEVETSSERPLTEVGDYVEADEARKGDGSKGEAVEAAAGEGVVEQGGVVTWGSTMVREVRESRATREDMDDFLSAQGSDDEGEREIEEVERKDEDGENGDWTGCDLKKESSVTGMTSTPRARGEEDESEGGKVGVGGGMFRRTLSRLRASAAADEGGVGKSGESEAIAVETGKEKRIRWEKNTKGGDEDEEGGVVGGDGEKGSGKKSTGAAGGGRILSRFRLGHESK